MKSYKLNKTLENTTFPIQQELAKLNQSTQKGVFKLVISLTTMLFGGIAASVICNEKLSFWGKFAELAGMLHVSKETFFMIILAVIYLVCIIVNSFLLLWHFHSEMPRNMRKKEYGRKQLAENFHKSIINDIVVGISFWDKANEQEEDCEVIKMYLCEACYYFCKAEEQIDQMQIFDDEKSNLDLVEEIGKQTLLSTLNVFKSGVDGTKAKLSNITNCSGLNAEDGELQRLMGISEKISMHMKLYNGSVVKTKI